jgi:Ser/Thr protein kinase RdoA (MazF antagonist)
MLNCLREKYADRLQNFKIVEDSYLTCSLPKNVYDYVITSMSVHYFPPAKRLDIYKRIISALKPGGKYIEGTYCSNSPEEERQVLDAFQRRTMHLDGADSGEWKVNIPLQTTTITHLLDDAGFVDSEWVTGKTCVVTAHKAVSPHLRTNCSRRELQALPKTERREVLLTIAEAGLNEFGLEGGTLTLIQDLVNTSYRVDHKENHRVLRIYSSNRHNTPALESELIFLEALSQSGFPAPRPLRTLKDGILWVCSQTPVSDPIRISVCSWLKGDVLQQDKTQSHFAAVGAMLARFHDFSAKWKPPADFIRPLCDSEGIFGNSGASGQEVMQAWENVAEPVRLDLQRAGDMLRLSETSIGKDTSRYGLIHADPSFGNVLFHNGMPSLIDFDDLAYGHYVFDLAVVLAGAWGKPGFEENRSSFLDNYRQLRELSRAELDALPVFMAARAASLIFWAAAQSAEHQWIAGQWQRLKEYMELLNRK